MGENWRKASGGAINVVIHAGGIQGSEASMVKMMRGRSLAAGMFTVVGLSQIDTSVGGLSFLPLTFRSWEEYDYVVEKLSPRLEKLLLDKGFVVLFWVTPGGCASSPNLLPFVPMTSNGSRCLPGQEIPIRWI